MLSIKHLAFISFLSICIFSASDALAMKGDPCNDAFRDKNGNLRPDKVRAYVMHEQFEIYRKADANCDGHLSSDEIRKFEMDAKLELQIELTKEYVDSNTKSGNPVPLDKNGEPPLPIVVDIEPPPNPCPPGWQFFLRNNAEEIRTFNCPKDFKSAAGAQFGYSRDGVTENTSWSAKGVAALAYVWRNPDPGLVAGYALAPWIAFNRLTNSSQSLRSKAVDLISYGGTAEVALAEILGGTQYFRASPQINSDFEGHAKSLSIAGEWQFVSNDYHISVPNPLGPYLTWEVDPILRTIYSSQRNGSQDPIFSVHSEAFRIGPVLAVTIAPVQNDFLVPHWLQPTSLNASFEWLTDTYTHRTYRLYNTAFNFPLDPTGHFGLQFNYQYGQLEATGQKVNLVTAGLAAKW